MQGVAEQQLRKVALGLTVLLGLVLLWGLFRLWFLSEPERISPAASSLSVGGIAASDEDLGEDLVQRPVFWVGRKPYEPPEETPEPATEEEEPEDAGALDKVKLVGVIGDGENTSIIVNHNGKSRRLRLQETIEGWTFTMYSPDGAMFEYDGRRRSIDLEHANPPPPPKSRAKRQASKNVAARTGARTNDRQRTANNRNNDENKRRNQNQARQNQNNR